MQAKKRSKLEIAYEVLSACRHPHGSARIMYMAKLNWAQIVEQLEYLCGRGFISKDENTYALTDFGREFLQGLTIIIETWQPMTVLIGSNGHFETVKP